MDKANLRLVLAIDAVTDGSRELHEERSRDRYATLRLRLVLFRRERPARQTSNLLAAHKADCTRYQVLHFQREMR